MILKDYSHQPGKSCRTVALRNLLARNGLDFTEDFVFGFANGLNFSFVKPNRNTESAVFKCIAPNLFQFENIAVNMGLEYQVITKASTDFSFFERVWEYEDNPVLCEVVPSVYQKYLKTDGAFWKKIKMDVPLTSHVTEVIGLDNNHVYFCENYSKNIFKMPKSVFVKARNDNKDSYLNPHHKIHYFMIPNNIKNISLEESIFKAIKNNVTDYCKGTNERLGLKAFKSFVDAFPQMYKDYGELVCRKSLKTTGSLIKYVSPGMFRKMYGRFLKDCTNIIGYEKELEKVSKLYIQADYLWNKFASNILKKEISIEECMTGKASIEILNKLNTIELECINRLVEVSAGW